ncbi:LysM domain-containing protein [Blastococcus sp. URHD0036]|uniref:LysM peptidoglycan-binding domain-containing protein n=1 Tax=Blastococcus sp. URHD0036 TaxID=1380356 RepID=UPI0004951140|nr:LysM domain-containing protein [Blastococcus sp. URHD0036]
MSLRRLFATTAAMAVTAALLASLDADLPGPGALAHPQAVADAVGPDQLVAGLAALLAWVAWGWGALGLLLTALSAAPGVLGATARLTGRLVLPASTRRAAAVALGLGLTVAGPGLVGCSTATEPAARIQSLPLAPPVPDWPAAAPPATSPPSASGDDPVPDWPSGDHVVVRGECLWDIAAADLRARTGSDPGDDDVARAVDAWWAANADVIGPDPDLLLPGQVLRAPVLPVPPSESELPG